MSEHAENHDHDHGHGHDHHDAHGEEHLHSHKKQYIIMGAVLTVLTIIELVVLPDVIGINLGQSILYSMLVVLAVVKLLFVIGVFMHLKDDRRIYSILFVSPMIMAVLMIMVLTAMVSLHWNPYQSAYASTGRCIADGECEKPWAAEEESWYQEQYAAAKTAGFAEGKTIFTTNCAACHGNNGQGMVGPAFTDNCYIHGGELNQMVTLVHKGVGSKGMPSWEGVLTNEQMDQVTYYISSMKDLEVENEKGCQGDPAK